MGTRSILKKINRHAPVDSDEYRRLVEYYENLRYSSPESYALFYQDYADILFRIYTIYLPRYTADIGDIVDLLVKRPELLASFRQDPLPVNDIPPEYHQYLSESLGQAESRRLLSRLLDVLGETEADQVSLPGPRRQDPVYIYEDANPFKEIGLKTHFERLGRFSFITRLQSYRYLSGNKASQDWIQYRSPDCLGGIFSNKEKSIYYYIFLSEADEVKARNAARLLNLVLYGKSGGA